MKKITTRILAGCIIATGFLGISHAKTITFDDLSSTEAVIQNGYGGLNWDNFYHLDSAVQYPGKVNGYLNGTVSASNVAFNNYANPATISSSTLFSLNDAYFTAAWRNGLQVHAVGTDGTNTYTKDFTVNGAAPVDVFFNWNGIDAVTFSSSGGTSAGYQHNNTQFVMDNLTINSPVPPVVAVPEPETYALLLAGLGAMGFVARRRKSV